MNAWPLVVLLLAAPAPASNPEGEPENRLHPVPVRVHGKVCSLDGGIPALVSGDSARARADECTTPLPGAKVEIKNARGLVVTATTGPDGSFALEPIVLEGAKADAISLDAPDHQGIHMTKIGGTRGLIRGPDAEVLAFLPRGVRVDRELRPD